MTTRGMTRWPRAITREWPRAASGLGVVSRGGPCGAALVPLLALCVGCPSPDAQGKYDRFNEQTEDERDRPEPKLDFGGPPIADTDTDTEGAQFPDINGVFLVAIDTSVSPGLPLQFLGEVTAEIDPMGDGTISVVFQPLSLDAGSTTEPREEVGDSISIDADVTAASFTITFGETMVTGAANPITGSDILADIALVGSIRNADAWCGTVEGEVLSPIQVGLEDSTFAAMRLADRSERPLMFPKTCAEVESMGIGAGGGDEGGDATTTGE